MMRRGHDDDDDDGAPSTSQNAGPQVPVLPWMRVPITIEQGRGVPLSEVHGLPAHLASALRNSEPPATLPTPHAWLPVHACTRYLPLPSPLRIDPEKQ